MVKLYIDIESRSCVDLRKTGVYPYVEHPQTELICLAGLLEQTVFVWLAPHFEKIVAGSSGLFESDVNYDKLPIVSLDHLNATLEAADEIVAHNVQFERVVLQKLGGRYGITDIPKHKWRCSMSKCGASSIPLGLGAAGKALGLVEEKDDAGHRLMLKMTKPKG